MNLTRGACVSSSSSPSEPLALTSLSPSILSGETDIIQCISSNASCSLDEMCSVRKPDQTLFWCVLLL